MSDNTGGPKLKEGMSLRDWFAGQALQGELISSSEYWSNKPGYKLAEYCY